MALIKTDDTHYKGIANRVRQALGLFEIDGDVFLPQELPAKVEEACDVSREEGHQAGYEQGHLDGWEEGRAEGGYDEGWADGYNAGYDGCIDTESEKWFNEGKSEGLVEGIEQGRAEGRAEGIEQGKQAQYDEFWDNYQTDGTRTNYATAFGGVAWTKEIFKPKYDIKPTSAYLMFRDSRITGDLVEICNDLGVTLDFSNCIDFQNTFLQSKFTRIGTIDLTSLTNASSANYLFSYATVLVTIDCIILPSTRVNFTSAFEGCSKLANLTIEGTIQYDLNIQNSPLTRASIESVMNSLSTTTSGYTVTFKKSAVNTAFETSAGANDGSTSEAWMALKNARTNWTIALV